MFSPRTYHKMSWEGNDQYLQWRRKSKLGWAKGQKAEDQPLLATLFSYLHPSVIFYQFPNSCYYADAKLLLLKYYSLFPDLLPLKNPNLGWKQFPKLSLVKIFINKQIIYIACVWQGEGTRDWVEETGRLLFIVYLLINTSGFLKNVNLLPI